MSVNLVDSETSVTVLAPTPCYPPGNFEWSWTRSSEEFVDGVRVVRLWTYQPRQENPALARRLLYYLVFALHSLLWLLLNIRSFDIVLTSTPPITTGIPGAAASVFGKSVFVDVRDRWIDNSVSLGYIDEDSILVKISRWFQWFVLHTADRILVMTPTLGAALVESYGTQLKGKLRQVPNGADIDSFAPQESSPSTGDSEDSGPVLVYTGNLGSAQALEPCIRAMTHVSRDDAVLRLVGDGDAKSQLEALVEELGISDRVEFVGLVDREEIPDILNHAEVGLAPLRETDELRYAVPTKLYEYLACGLPVLVTGRGEIERFVRESGGGIHTEAEPEAIAAALDGLLEDDERRSQMGLEGRQYVSDRYDRKRIAGRLREELHQFENSSRGRAGQDSPSES